MKTDKLKLFVLALIAFFIITVLFTGCSGKLTPSARYAKTHQDKSWTNYQNTWMDKEIEQAKAQKEQEKAKEKRLKELENHRAKIARIKGNE